MTLTQPRRQNFPDRTEISCRVTLHAPSSTFKSLHVASPRNSMHLEKTLSVHRASSTNPSSRHSPWSERRTDMDNRHAQGGLPQDPLHAPTSNRLFQSQDILMRQLLTDRHSIKQIVHLKTRAHFRPHWGGHNILIGTLMSESTQCRIHQLECGTHSSIRDADS